MNFTFKILFIILFYFSINGLYSQNLSLDDVIRARTMTLGEVEEFLTKNSWEFLEADPPDENYMGEVLFGYNVTRNGKDSFAEFSIWYYYDGKDLNSNKILIQVVDSKLYETYLNRIKQYNCELIESTIVDGSIVKYYKGKNITFKITITNRDNSDNSKVTAYIFLIYSNE